jgi:cytochrome P450
VTALTGTSQASPGGVYYDPFDFAIDNDPYPVWKRLRDEAPLYWNERYKFFALSRYDDVALALPDWQTYRSGRGTIPEVIFSGMEIPPGIILFEDPPLHDLHRRLLARVFTRRRMAAVEPLVRRYCAAALDELAGRAEFDVIGDLGALIPMRTIGYLLGIPESAQASVRDNTGRQLTLEQEELRTFDAGSFRHANDLIGDYIDWRAGHPSDDLMTELLAAEIEENGERRRLTRTEVLTYANTIAGAGNETTTRLVGFMTELLAEHPGQLAQVAADRSLVPNVVEETLRFEAPSPLQARWVERDVEVHGQRVPAGTVMFLLNGSANRDERRYENPGRFDIHRTKGHLSFGYGLHQCLGAALARLEGQVALEEMLKRWPRWAVDRSRAERAHTASVRGWAKLPVLL